MNYKKLLMLYIEHVGNVEGTTFIQNRYAIDGLSEEEMDELKRLDDLLFRRNVEEIANEF